MALCRSWNRWLADIWQQGGTRIRWMCVLPLLSMQDALDLQAETRVLFKTRNSQLLRRSTIDLDFVAFSEEAAQTLVGRGVKLVGLDYLSVAHADEQILVHRAFLDHGVVLRKGIDLSEVPPGCYELIRLRGADGAQCRAVLRDLTEWHGAAACQAGVHRLQRTDRAQYRGGLPEARQFVLAKST